MGNLFEDYMSAQCLIKSLKNEIEEFKSGKRYIKLQEDHHRVIAGYIKECLKNKKEIADLNARIISNRNMMLDDQEALWKECRAEVSKVQEENRKLEDRLWENEIIWRDKVDKLTRYYEDRLHENDCVINELKNRLAHAEALLGRDGTNTGLPTSKTPLDKRKRIPNSREKSKRKKGGQPGHERHVLEKPDESEVTEVVEHDLCEEGSACPNCGSDCFTYTGDSDEKYEYDVKITVTKTKHVYPHCECSECGTIFVEKAPVHLRGEVGYGSTLQALALTLTNNVNAAMNKNAMFLAGITGGELTPCEGYIAKLQKRAAVPLVEFCDDLKMRLITRKIIYWDDTVIMIMTKRGCLRFYGDENIAYYTAHETKGWVGIDEDGILELLTSDTWVMHDHNRINYNEKFCFKNLECNEHLQRDCQKNTDDTQHKWSADVKSLISKTIKEGKKALADGYGAFSDSYIKTFNEQLDGYLADGWKENEKHQKKYGAEFECALLKRINKYRDNYFGWMKDFTLPTTNNLSERSLRGIKSHEKISGQFESVATARYHAAIKTYTETCRRNGINEFEALKRLCEGNPYTVQEIFDKK